MHAAQLLHKLLRNTCSHLHRKRQESLYACAEGLLYGQTLTVTHIGRSIRSKGLVKHNIKRADRLLSNRALQEERFDIYRNVAHYFVKSNPSPVVLIDWSDLTPNRSHFLLRASLAVKGRPLTLYEEVHTGLDNREVHRRFLQRLKQLLPDPCRPVVVTDAGFRGTWFEEVARLNWEWVGRIRGRTLCAYPYGEWFSCQALMKEAKRVPKHLGRMKVIRNREIHCELYLVKERPKGRTSKTLSGKRRRDAISRDSSRGAKEPWLIATSITGKSARSIIQYYRQRMQIEESFRDMKSARYGLSLEFTGSYKTDRLKTLLLLAHIVYLVLFILGTAAEITGQHRQFQSNSVTRKRVLSVIYLAALIVNNKQYIALTAEDYKKATEYINCLAFGIEAGKA